MMNYLWGGLILISVLFASVGDLSDIVADTYQNDREYDVTLSVDPVLLVDRQPVELQLIPSDTRVPGKYRTSGKQTQILVEYSEHLPDLWQARFSKDRDKPIILTVVSVDDHTLHITLPAIVWPRMQRMMQSAFDMAEFAAKLALGLIGLMALWLGLMQIAEQSGLVASLVKIVRPVLKPLFPDVPDDHPAMGAISLNLAANMLGLGNAATPLGIKAMQHLQELNEQKDTASNSMCMFLALNTSSVQLLPPVTVIALLGVGAGGLFVSIFLATLCSTIVAILAARWYARRALA
jgi:spore maturation protein A